MKLFLQTGLSPACLVTTSLLMAASAQAAFTYTGGNLNATQTYDGAGVDAALNPHTIGSATQNDYIGTGAAGTGVLTVTSGNLTLNASDFKIGNGNTTANGTVNANGGVLTINQIGQWGGGVGQVGSGTLNVATGATVNWQTSGSSEQRFMVGNGTGGQGFLNLNGGSLSNYFDPVQSLTDAERGWRAGADGGTATISLNSGMWSLNGAVPFFLGGKYSNLNTTPTLVEGASVSVMTITNGTFKQTGITVATGLSTTSSTFYIGANDYVNFITGGTGGLSIQGWDSATDPGYTKFKALIDAGKIRKDGAIFTPGNYSAFLFSDDSGQGVLKIDNSALIAPSIVTQPVTQLKFVGETATFTAVASGSPTPALLWEVSTDNGATWTSTGVTTSSLSVAGLTYSMNGRQYHLKATNAQGTVTSNAVGLTVSYPSPTISGQPVTINNAAAGGTASFSVSASGMGSPLGFQWQKSVDGGNAWTNVAAATSAAFSINPISHSDAGLYRCVVSDPAATADSLPPTTATSNWAYLSLSNTSTGFVWNPVNGTMTYAGGGVDSVINPYTQVADNFAIGLNAGNTGSLTVNSGTLTLLNKDQWAPKIGQSSANGIVTVNTGATLNLVDTGAGGAGANSEQRVSIGNSATGTLNVNGGSVTVSVGPGTDGARGFRIGVGNSAAFAGTLNLNSGTLTYTSDARVDLGSETAVGIINVGNGHFVANQTSTLVTGSNDFINFESGKTGSVAFLGWGSSDTDGGFWPNYGRFRSLVTSGRVKIDGGVVTDDTRFVFSDSGGLGVMTLDPAQIAPVINENPIDQIVQVGANATFTASVSGNPVPSLQWQLSVDSGGTWSNISGATGSSYSISSAAYNLNGTSYRLVANNSLGAVETLSASLTVFYPDPVIASQPIADTAIKGTGASFSVAATGLGTLSYQWQHSSDGGFTWNPTGGNVATLSFPSVAISNGGLYKVTVTDLAGQVDGAATSVESGVTSLSVIDAKVPTQVISLNFPGTSTAAGSVLGLLAPNEATGVTDSANWNNAATVTQVSNRSGGDPLHLIDSNGSATTAAASWASANTWSVRAALGAFASKSPNEKLLHGYIEQRPATGSSVTISSIPYTTYDVYAYMSGEHNNIGSVYVNGNTATAQFYRSISTARAGLHLASATTAENAAADQQPGTVIRFSGLSGASLTLNQLDATGHAGGFAAIQIVNMGDDVLGGYAAWSTVHAGGQGADLDYDGDGVKNGVEFFMNSAAGFTANPAIVGSGVTWPNGGNIPSSAYGSQFKVQTSSNLSVWNDVLVGDSHLANTTGSVSYTLPTGAGKLFVRLFVTPN